MMLANILPGNQHPHIRDTEGEVMTRRELLALYRPVRASIKRVLRLATGVITKADITRAAKQLGIWSEEGLLSDDDEAMEMLSDIALFEPNQRGRRPFDTFLTQKVQLLSEPDLAMAQRMAGAFFSLFRCAGEHEVGGIWVEDILNEDRRLWIMDKGLEKSAPADIVFGMRLFDAGPFHAGFGIITEPNEETISLCVRSVRQSKRIPFRYSLAATLYGDKLREELPIPTDMEEMVRTFLDALAQAEEHTRHRTSAPGRKRSRPG
jgi:hypothetical protein